MDICIIKLFFKNVVFQLSDEIKELFLVKYVFKKLWLFIVIWLNLDNNLLK